MALCAFRRFVRRSEYCITDAPAIMQPSPYRRALYSTNPCPLCHCMTCSVTFQEPVCRAIVLLFSLCCPSAVVWLIIPARINAIYCQIVIVSIRHSPRSERRIIIPFLADFYPSAAIPMPAVAIRTHATFPHGLPYPV